MILGIDAGNYEVKVMGPYGPYKFLSCLGEWRKRKLEQTFSKDDMEYYFEGKRGFAGTLAKYESEFIRSRMGDTKAHEDARLRVLLAIHRYSDAFEHSVVVGQPIEKHDHIEKNAIKEMLRGRHELEVNGVTKTIVIRRVEVAAEGAASFWCQPELGIVRIIDIGSGTVNGATLNDKRYIDKEAFTLNYGMNTNKSNDLESLAESIITKANKWGRQDFVRLIGGSAEMLAPYLKKYFNNLSVFEPTIFEGNSYKLVHPVYANSIGFYEIARSVFK
ncbi:hypothetical protein BKP37_12620 [Anaerobacillus alkalilacustris]|uniref:Actin-like protein N-terminal domain-containing protein n=1 Tax=Anaerobacillus alkalilacustris TaxID=393763 RepID=A0A1S2LJP5_9BACI|nr:ParM/StbA family protein [Anaerobacillus alkalilacustris]OIJ12641.1 hypothetical protein BKP37_12620 [Anaerobacillus alkalilacustris]